MKSFDKRRFLYRLLFYVLGLFILAMGVSVSVNSNLGISPVNSLPYEVSVIKNFALPLFEQLTPEMERYEEIGHLLEAYPKFMELDEKYVEPDSLIREFIGGGIYDD